MTGTHTLLILAILVGANAGALYIPVDAPLPKHDSVQNLAGLAHDANQIRLVSDTALAPLDDQALAAITTRPLFNPMRLPAEPQPAGKQPATAAKKLSRETPPFPIDLIVVGIVADEYNKRVALVRTGDWINARSFTVGSEIDGWKLSEIDAGTVSFEHGASRCKLAIGKAAPSESPCAAKERRTSGS